MIKYVLVLVCVLWVGLYSFIWGADPTVVPYVDINRYLGKWYEVARLPNAFEPVDATHTFAEYSLNSDGTIRVKNQCRLKNGEVNRVVGVAKIVDTKSQSKLAVSFFDILGFRPIWGDYWILGLGDNYEYSVVGDRSRKFAWILSRTPVLSPSLLAKALGVLTQNGFVLDPLIYPKHDLKR